MNMKTDRSAQVDEGRRTVLGASVAAAAAIALPASAQAAQKTGTGPRSKNGKAAMNTVTTKDGTSIYYKDWGTGQPVVFSHGWPLTGDAWDAQMFFLSNNGYRTIAHDRRGHGRSSQPWNGNDMDTYADDLAQVIEALDLNNVVL